MNHERVDHRENRGVCAETKREAQHDERSDARPRDERAPCVSGLDPERVHGGISWTGSRWPLWGLS
jgi:hypothetical protein